MGALALLWVLAIATVSVLHVSSWVERHFATGIMPLEHGRWWTPLTAGLWAPNLVGYLVATVLIFLVVAPIERKIGPRRVALAALITQIAGAALGLGAAAIAKLVDESWGFRLHLGTAVGPTTWIFGVVLVASSQMGTLWRRRVRVGLFALLITLALFAGQLQDIIRLAAAVVGLAVGVWLVGKSERGEHITGTRREGRVLVALIVAATAIGPALAALSPHAVGPLAVLRDLFRGTPYSAAEVAEICQGAPDSLDCRRGELDLRLSGVGPTILSLMPSLFLLVLSDGLRRGRRFAWYASVAAQLVLLGLSIFNFTIRFVDELDSESSFYGFDPTTHYMTIAPFLTPLAVLIVLLVTRKFFDVRAPRATYVRLALALLTMTVGLAVVYIVGGLVARSGFKPEPTLGGLIEDFPDRMLPPVYLQWLNPEFLPESWFATLLYEWTGVVFWLSVTVLVMATFLAPAYGALTGATGRARELLRRSGGTALSWMTTWRGNNYWFAEDGDSFVAFRVIGGVALTTGDPVGPRDRLRANVVDFAEYAAGKGWTPCFYSVSDGVRQIAADLGWGAIQVAEETVLDLQAIAFTGKKFQDIRTALNKAKKSGVEAEWVTFHTAPLEISDQIVAISEEWVADKGMPEMGFTLGGLEEVDDPDVRCLIAVDADRHVHGVTSWLPVYSEGRIVGWTLDFMRRRAGDGFRPAMEFLIASAALKLAEEGADFVSLSGAPLAKVEQPEGGDGAVAQDSLTAALDRLLDVLGRTLEPVYGFRSLLAFKSKFQPRYEPMFMAFPDPAALPSIGNAIGRAYLPEVSLGQGMKLMRTIIDR
ncbi:bifunctional lysylphosphatidylglycerol flippase/synthetase MprF [Antrihabitans sp. YC2-6]|uniref:bifunctional lysylphosphatidylglycerol flippase/synthetase MprF n=1 Tax=Antrihabitans sp. YC2-6 TaxID=2799498 RepID=UPI001F294A1E|nr:DUF2156 domain-containing protein [Antrihabitans sp. YC2-6]